MRKSRSKQRSWAGCRATCQAVIDNQVADDAPLGQVVERCACGGNCFRALVHTFMQAFLAHTSMQGGALAVQSSMLGDMQRLQF